jgi:hypothetical protein
MKTTTLITLFLLIPMMTIAQNDTTAKGQHAFEIGMTKDGLKAGIHRLDTNKRDSDTLRIELKHKVIKIISTPRFSTVLSADSLNEDLRTARRERRNAFTYWSGVDFGINTFIASDGRIGDGPKAGPFLLDNLRSRWVGINFMEEKYEFGSHHAGFFWGLGLEFTGYHLSENVRLAYNGDSTYAVPVTDKDFTKNKIRQIGLRLPLMFEFNTKRSPLPDSPEAWKKYHHDHGFHRSGNFHFAAGVVGSWYFDNMYKQKYKEGSETRKVRDNGDYNLLPYRVAARAQIGIGGVNLFAEYGLTPLFKDGTAPLLTPLTVGITLIGFN